MRLCECWCTVSLKFLPVSYSDLHIAHRVHATSIYPEGDDENPQLEVSELSFTNRWLTSWLPCLPFIDSLYERYTANNRRHSLQFGPVVCFFGHRDCFCYFSSIHHFLLYYNRLKFHLNCVVITVIFRRSHIFLWDRWGLLPYFCYFITNVERKGLQLVPSVDAAAGSGPAELPVWPRIRWFG